MSELDSRISIIDVKGHGGLDPCRRCPIARDAEGRFLKDQSRWQASFEKGSIQCTPTSEGSIDIEARATFRRNGESESHYIPDIRKRVPPETCPKIQKSLAWPND